MTPPRIAVILAAGRGVRLGPLGLQIPKGFIELGGVPIIERSLALLAEAGFARTVIVTGHLSGFYETLATRLPNIELIHNPRYAESGSMHSLYCALPALTEDVLLLESDLVYERRALQAVRDAPGADTLLVSGPTRSGDEVHVEAAQGRLTGLSKQRDALAGDVIGELVGITRLSTACLQAMGEHAESVFRRTLHLEYEQALVAAARRAPVHCHLMPDLAWCEIDDAQHLARARERVFPLVLERDRSGDAAPC